MTNIIHDVDYPLPRVTNPKGRPPFPWTQEIEDFIIEQITNGMGLYAVCKLPGMPNKMTVDSYCVKNPEFDARLRRAYQALGEACGEQLLEVNRMVYSEEIDHNQANAISQNLRWMASRLARSRYGESRDVTITGKLTLGELVEQSMLIDATPIKAVPAAPEVQLDCPVEEFEVDSEGRFIVPDETE